MEYRSSEITVVFTAKTDRGMFRYKYVEEYEGGGYDEPPWHEEYLTCEGVNGD